MAEDQEEDSEEVAASAEVVADLAAVVADSAVASEEAPIITARTVTARTIAEGGSLDLITIIITAVAVLAV